MDPPVWERVRPALRSLGALGRDPTLRRGLWILLFIGATAALFASVSLPSEVNLRAGEVAPFTIRSPRDLVNQAATAAARQQAADKVPPVYSVDSGISQQALDAFDVGAQAIVQARAGLAASPAGSSSASVPSSSSAAASPPGAATSTAAAASARLASAASALGSSLALGLLADDYAAVLQAQPSDVASVSAAARGRLEALLSGGVLDEQGQLSAAQQTLEAQVLALQAPAAVDRVFASLAAQALVPDRFVDDQATAAAQQQAEDAVAPVTIARGQVIVREGDVVGRDAITVLVQAGLLHPGGTFGLLAGAVLLSTLLLVLCWAFLAQFHPRTLRVELHLILFGSVLVVALAGVRLGLPVSAYLAPVAWGAMVASVAFGPGVGLFVGGVGGLAAGLLVHDLSVAAVALVGAWTAVFSLRRLTQRADLLRAGFYAALVQGGAALLLVGLFLGQDSGLGSSLASAGSVAHPVLRAVAAAAFSGLLCGVLAIGSLPYAEALGVLTPFRLLELANPGQPLLRRLLVEAPGTYHHSLMVANLAEAACQAVGGDALLVRAGAYYHDIGKMKRPVFFVENQLGGENPHDKLSPHLSSLVITSHVRDGVEVARQARLPEEILDFIRTHHGTTLVQYFYNAARQKTGQAAAEAADGRAALAAVGAEHGASRAAPAQVAEEDFRYDGPLPSTRETAVVMLADGVEAAVRSLRHPSAEDIEGVISRIITDRLEDGQLDEASLTLRDLHTISVTFRRILLGAYHARVEYPEALASAVSPPRLTPPPARPRA